MASEKDLEADLVKYIKIRGGWTLKFLPFLVNGLPDRIILMPGGRCYFAEVKSTGENPRKLQRVIHRKFRELGFKVFIIDSYESLTKCLREI
jgi:hypothetical protein